VPLEARDDGGTVLAGAARQVVEHRTCLALDPGIEGLDLDVLGLEPIEGELGQSTQALGRHDHQARQARPLACPRKLEGAVQGDGGLAVAGLAEHEHRLSRRQPGDFALVGIELVDRDHRRGTGAPIASRPPYERRRGASDLGPCVVDDTQREVLGEHPNQAPALDAE